MTRLPVGPHGGDGARLAAVLGLAPTEVLDLSASLNPVAPDIDDLVRENLDALGRYPDTTTARDALASMLAVEPGRLVLTNGGAEAIAAVAALHPVGWVEGPEFSLYERHLSVLDPAGPRWRSNPNNPLGHLAEPDERAEVWDEAFHVLATGCWTRGDDDAWRLGSLTKAFACPGLRLGYVIAPSQADADRLAGVIPRWSVNGIAASVVPAMIERAEPARWHRQIAELRRQLVGLLARAGIVAEAADANWVIVRDRGDLRGRLALHGVLVRDTASFGFDGVRIAVPDADGLEHLDRVLDRIAEETT